jgi:hypothetical protein
MVSTIWRHIEAPPLHDLPTAIASDPRVFETRRVISHALPLDDRPPEVE